MIDSIKLEFHVSIIFLFNSWPSRPAITTTRATNPWNNYKPFDLARWIIFSITFKQTSWEKPNALNFVFNCVRDFKASLFRILGSDLPFLSVVGSHHDLPSSVQGKIFQVFIPLDFQTSSTLTILMISKVIRNLFPTIQFFKEFSLN